MENKYHISKKYSSQSFCFLLQKWQLPRERIYIPLNLVKKNFYLMGNHFK